MAEQDTADNSRTPQDSSGGRRQARKTRRRRAMGGDGRGERGRARRAAAPIARSIRKKSTGCSGFSLADLSLADHSGIRAIINSAMVSYERLPMLEIVFDRLVRLMTTSLRNLTSDNVEVSLDRITSVRFGEYLNSIPLPTILAVFKAEEWENFGLFSVNSNLIYAMIDVLLGGRRGQQQRRVDGRPYTTIETGLVKRMIEVVLADAEVAFRPGLAGALYHRPAGDQSALRRDLAADQRCDPGAAADRHGRSRRQHRNALALRHHRADPRDAAASLHGRQVRPRSDLGRPSRHRNLAGRGRGRRRALRRSACRSSN